MSQEVLIDSIRMIDRVLEISEPLRAPGSVAFDAVDFDQDRSKIDVVFRKICMAFEMLS